MTRPHAFPRKQSRRHPSPFPALDLQLPHARVFASVNMSRGVKALVDHFQSYLSFREGRAVSQVETMHVLLELALSNAAHPVLSGYELPAFAKEENPP